MKRFLIPALAALAGLLSLAILFPRYDPAASIGQTLDRGETIAKAKATAAKFGVNAAAWDSAAVELFDKHTARTEVALAPADRRGSVTVRLYPDGSVASWHPSGVDSSQRTIDDPSGDPSRHPQVRQKTVRTFNDGQSKVTFEEDDDQKSSFLAWRIITACWYTALFVYFPIVAIRRRVHYRLPLILAAAQIIWAVLSYWGTNAYQQFRIDGLTGSQSWIVRVFSNLEANAGAPISFLVLVAVGFAIRTPGNREKWGTLELLGQGGYFNRAVGSSITTGLLTGLGLAAIPYLLVACGLVKASSFVYRSVEALAAPSALTLAIRLSVAVTALGTFGFAYPVVAKIKNRYLRWIVFAPIGIAIFDALPNPLPFHEPLANFYSATAIFAACAVLFLRTDLLATMTSLIAARAILTPCVLLVQPGGAVRAAAVPVLLVGAAVLAVSLRSALRGREGIEAVPDTEAPEPVAAAESGRIRLSAEFEIARKAQMDALPGSAPPLKGYSLAGSCTPAQQVGGDLYDYFHLADGRLGITVADVSGKGVPVALYMMVTKGLLLATARDSADLSYILGQINTHLYRACKKKVFVTMGAVALDPERHRLQHARAGHNPTVWRRAKRGETVVLKPGGLGLGMAAAQFFGRTLKIEEVDLEPGDAVVLYSDGITEAVDSKMEQYGEARLISAVERTDGWGAEESRAAILHDMAEFVKDTPPRDDVTLVVLRVAENAA